jgi:SAM-dependent methyltransferase
VHIGSPRYGAPSKLVSDSIGWDVATWARALPFWTASTALGAGARALEVGAGGDNAGLSLWLATQGFEVTCSGLGPPADAMLDLHRHHDVADRVTYACADVLTMPYVEAFDLVVFKSVLGRVGGHDRFDRQQAAVRKMYEALRPGGELWFAENAAGMKVHQLARRRFGAGLWHWRYVALDELPALLTPFDDYRWTTFGLTSAFGRTERQRRSLAAADRWLDRTAPRSWHYVVAVVASKAPQS